jgi:hypothetical protein
LLVSTTASAVCDASQRVANDVKVLELATRIVGDPRLRIVDARFTGSCQQLAAASFDSAHAFSSQTTGALVLSTGKALDITNTKAQTQLSTDWGRSGNAAFGPTNVDAAMLEIDITVTSGTSSTSQLVLGYMLASEEYAIGIPMPDLYLVQLQRQYQARYTNVNILAGGRPMAPPGSTDVPSWVKVFVNTAGQYQTALGGFTQASDRMGSAWQQCSDEAAEGGAWWILCFQDGLRGAK